MGLEALAQVYILGGSYSAADVLERELAQLKRVSSASLRRQVYAAMKRDRPGKAARAAAEITANQVQAAGGTPILVQADVRHSGDLKRLAESMDRIDVLVHNAAMGVLKPMLAIMLVDVVLLLVWTFYDPLKYKRSRGATDYDAYGYPLRSHGMCSSSTAWEFVGPLIALHVGLLLYANVSRGFKAGSFPVITGATVDVFAPARQERVTSY